MTKTAKARGRHAYHHGDLRETLLAVAETELSEKGIEGFSLRGVAKRAGVSHAAPAHHFRDSNGLLTALAAIAACRFHQSMKDFQAAAPKDARSQFIASGRGYVEFARANPALFDLLFGSKRPDINSEDVTKPSADAFMILVDGVAALTGQIPLETRAGRIEILAAWSLVHGLANLLNAGRLHFLASEIEADLDRIITETIDRVVPGAAET